jgi:hypothetical protein
MVGSSRKPLNTPTAASTFNDIANFLPPLLLMRGTLTRTPVTRPPNVMRGTLPMRIPSVLLAPGTGFPPLNPMPACG